MNNLNSYVLKNPNLQEEMLCRNAFRDGKPALAVAMKHQKGFDLKMKIEKLDFNDQILLIKSCLLGHKAADNNSFTQQLLRWL